MPRLVIRPGETDFDVQDRVQGALELPLNERGKIQLRETIEALREIDLDILYASPTEPALSSARRIGAELDLPVKVLDHLVNQDLGLWQGLCRSEIRQKQPRVFRQWEEAPESVCPPYAEPCEETVARVKLALRKVVRRGGSFAIVASEPIATLIASLLKGDPPSLCVPDVVGGDCGRIQWIEGEMPLSLLDSWTWTRQ
jgi:probable phosphoglycerate mutase